MYAKDMEELTKVTLLQLLWIAQSRGSVPRNWSTEWSGTLCFWEQRPVFSQGRHLFCHTESWEAEQGCNTATGNLGSKMTQYGLQSIHGTNVLCSVLFLETAANQMLLAFTDLYLQYPGLSTMRAAFQFDIAEFYWSTAYITTCPQDHYNLCYKRHVWTFTFMW